jgi:hypothetical protein
MKKGILLSIFLMTFMLSFSQGDKTIVTNDELVNEYLRLYVDEAENRGLDIKDILLNKVDYILITTKDIEIPTLSKTHLNDKLIVLDYKVYLDRLILKVNLYRELSYVLGVPYNNGSIIMSKDRGKQFSYSAFDDIDIMNIELSKVLALVK